MANIYYNVAKRGMVDGSVDLDTDTIKMLLVAGTAAGDPDHATVAAALAVHAELSTTGYTAGASSASRKTLTITPSTDNTNDRADAVTNSQTWTAVAASASPNDKIQKLLIYKHTGTNDAANIPIALIDTASGLPLTLNGSDVTVAAQTIRVA